MRRSGRAGALQYVPELTWMLFLRILDEREEKEAEQRKAVGADFRPSLEYPYRWRDWAAPPDRGLRNVECRLKRKELQNSTLGAFMSFVNGELIPYLCTLKNKPGAILRQKVISEVFSSIEETGIDTERNLLDILDKIHNLNVEFGMRSADLSKTPQSTIPQSAIRNQQSALNALPQAILRKAFKGKL